MFSLCFVLAEDATRNKLRSNSFRDLITQILHFLLDQRKQQLGNASLRVPSVMEADQDLLETSKFASEQEVDFTTADPNAVMQLHPYDLDEEGIQLFHKLQGPSVGDRHM